MFQHGSEELWGAVQDTDERSDYAEKFVFYILMSSVEEALSRWEPIHAAQRERLINCIQARPRKTMVICLHRVLIVFM
jgi:hypothetical protein